MKPALLKYLNCINCGSNLSLEIFDQRSIFLSDEEKELILQTKKDVFEYETEIMRGILICTQCRAFYPIHQGVPRIYKDAGKDFSLNNDMPISLENTINKEEKIQASFSREWDEFDYDDQTIWLWTVDERIDSFCEEIGISSPEELKGKLMIDVGCGSGVLSMELSKRYLIEIIALDISHVVNKAFHENKSNLCHFIQASVLTLPLAECISDITYSHGVLHHTSDTKRAFKAIAKLTRPSGLLYVWLYGKKKGWNRVRFLFIRAARAIISRLPKNYQDVMIHVMASIHLAVRFVKRYLWMEKVQYKTMSQFLVGIRDKYTHLYAREHTENEVKKWFRETGHKNVVRGTNWEKTKWWKGSTDLSIRGIRLKCVE